MDTQHGHAGLAMQQAVTETLTCHRICEETITHCLHTGGRHADGDHIRLMLDCADVCRTTADLMTRGSRFATRISTLCAEICEACAAGCETFRDDSTMAACAQSCRRCAQTCRQLASATTQ